MVVGGRCWWGAPGAAAAIIVTMHIVATAEAKLLGRVEVIRWRVRSGC